MNFFTHKLCSVSDLVLLGDWEGFYLVLLGDWEGSYLVLLGDWECFYLVLVGDQTWGQIH